MAAARTIGQGIADWFGIAAMAATVAIVLVAALPLVKDGGLFNWPGLAIVFAGTVTVTLSTMLGADFRAFCAGISHLLMTRSPDLPADAGRLIKMAEECRRIEPSTLDRRVDKWRHYNILYHGLLMHLDGKESSEIQFSVERLMISNDGWWAVAILAVRRASETAPAMGLLGTLIGLLGMLGKLDNPAEIGPAMALALLTTLYGAFLAYGILAPLADRLERLRQLRRDRMSLEAATVRSITRNEHVRHLQTLMISLLNPKDRSGLPGTY